MVIPMILNRHFDLYVASCSKEGGIVRLQLLPDGKINFLGLQKIDRPMYMIETENKLHVVLRAPFESNNSGYINYQFDVNGELACPSEVVSTNGIVACHLAVLDGAVYVVNYLSGNVSKLPDKVVTHEGKGIHEKRQDMPHTHYISTSPDDKYLLVTDLGIDKIFVYDKDLNYVSSVDIPKGNGPRHLAFHEDKKTVFCVNELSSSISVLEYEDGKLKLLGTFKALPDDYRDENTSAAIRVSGDLVYVSNRGHDSIGVFQFNANNNTLNNIRFISTHGKGPRDFIIIGEYAIVTNEISDNVVSVSLADGEIKDSVNIKSPICVIAR